MAMYQRVPSYPRGVQTREGLLKAAKPLFLLKGIASATVDDICLAAGVSKGGFYHHFADKESAFLEVALEELEREMKLATSASPSPVERRSMSALLIDLWAWAPRHPPALRRVRAVHRRTLRRLSRLQKRTPHDRPSEGDREAQAALALFMGVGRVALRAMAGRPAISKGRRRKAATG